MFLEVFSIQFLVFVKIKMTEVSFTLFLFLEHKMALVISDSFKYYE